MTDRQRGWSASERDRSVYQSIEAAGELWLMSRTRYVLLLLTVAISGGVNQHQLVAQQPAAATSPLLEEPTSPEAVFDSVVLMVELARPGLARRYLDQLMMLDLDEPTLLRLRDKHGPAIFLRLADLEYLQPGSIQLVQKMNEAFRRVASDPARVDRLINDLQKSPAQRDVAILQLRSGGALVVPRLITGIRELNKPGQQELLQYTLVKMGEVVVPPLIGALESTDPNLRAIVIQVLGRVGDRSTAGYLWNYAATDQETPAVRLAATKALARLVFGDVRRVNRLNRTMAIQELIREAKRHLGGNAQWRTNTEGQVGIWQFDPQQPGRLVEIKVKPGEARFHAGSRFALQAVRLSEGNRTAQGLFLSLALARDRERVGWKQPLPRGEGSASHMAVLAGQDALANALRLAVHHENPQAAASVLEVMRLSAGPHDLVSSPQRPSPLIAALNYPDRRVQFGSAVVIVEMDPPSGFRQSSRVVEILHRAIRTENSPHVVVSGPNPAAASNLAGMFEKSGYRSMLAATGRDAFKVAARRDDVDLIVLDANVVRWGLSQTVANLRADARTSMIPIAVVGNEKRLASVGRLQGRYSLITYFIRPANTEALKSQLTSFLTGLQSASLSESERAQRSAMAVSLLSFLADGNRKHVFDLRPLEGALFDAIANPALADNALFALATLPTVSTQERLSELVMQETLEEDLRVTAAAHLVFHIQRRGLLLSKQRVADLKTTHSVVKAPELKSALAAIQGALRPDAKSVDQRLLKFGVPRPR